MKILTPVGEFCYVNVFRPDAPMEQGDEPQYKNSVIWPKDEEKKLRKLEAAILEVAESKWGKKAKAMLDKGQLKSPIVDGDMKNAEWLDDHWMLTAKSTDKPGIVDADLEDIIDSTEVYPGAFGRMDIYLYPYDKRGNQGVGAILNNLQKTEDGERKDGRETAAEAFSRASDDDDEAPKSRRAKTRHEDDDDDIPSRREKPKKKKKSKK